MYNQNESINQDGSSLYSNSFKAWRENFGLTQGEFAKREGIKQPELVRLEKPESNPRKSTLKKIADALEISVEQLIE